MQLKNGRHMAKENKKALKQAAAQKQRQKKEDKARRDKALKQIKPLLFSLLLWVVLMIMAHVADHYWHIADGVVALVVSSTIFIGNALGFDVAHTVAPHLQVAGFDMQVIFECTAYNFYLFVIALVVFAPWSWKDKLINYLIFTLSVFLLNASRFIVMGYVGRAFPQLFHQIHDYVWTILFALLIAVLYIWRNKKYSQKV